MPKGLYLGVDGCKEGWVAVALHEDGTFCDSMVAKELSVLIDYYPKGKTIGVDMPLDLVNEPTRIADQLVRKELGPKRGRSVFPAIPKFMIEPRWINLGANELNDESRNRFDCAFSRQTINLKKKILEVNQCSLNGSNIIEVHPELCFMHMNNGVPLSYSKKTWNGMQHRLSLLTSTGIKLPNDMGPKTGIISSDDIIDAAAVAWTVRRYAFGKALSYPDDHDSPQIWV